MRIRVILSVAALALAGLLLAGCSTYSGTRDDGVYYQTSQHRGGAAHVDPTLYPYWSLDYFYYSHYYQPYSVLVHRYDPWYYPYPGWYYGYRSWQYGHWRDDSGAYERFDNRNRIRQIDARLRELETRRSLSIRSQRPDRHLTPRTAPWMQGTGRGTAMSRNDPRRRPATPPPASHDGRRPQRTAEPSAPIRQRPVDSSPTRSSRQRSSGRERARAPTRSRPPQSRPRSDPRERRQRH